MRALSIDDGRCPTSDGLVPETVPRFPYWLGPLDREHLIESVHQSLAVRPAHDPLIESLESALTELGVAAARDLMWPVPGALVRTVNGYAPDVLPVRLSDQEVEAVLTLPGLLATTAVALGVGTRR